MATNLYPAILAFLVGGSSLHVNAQQQIGADIDGEAAFDHSGWSVSMPDPSTVAIGAVWNDGNGNESGHVRVYTWNGSQWTQKGTDIDGEASNDESGYSVSMPDANTIAIGAPFNSGNGSGAGHVRVYSWSGSAWTQVGNDLDGKAVGDYSGCTVSMPDAATVAIGAYGNNDNGSMAGQTRIYSWNGNTWAQKGTDLLGEATGDNSGWAVSMPDANTVAIGARYNDGSGTDAGHVRVYSWTGSLWMAKGADIDGENASDHSGWAVSMPDSNTVAIGAPGNDGNGSNAGHVRVYVWTGSAWSQKGTDIDGEYAADESGTSVSMPDANTVAIGAPGNSANGNWAGHVRVYHWNGSAWTQMGNDIDGEFANDASGWFVSMGDDATVAIGGYLNDGNGTDAGHARVFGAIPTATTEISASPGLSVYPNPASGEVTITCGQAAIHRIEVIDLMGQRILLDEMPLATLNGTRRITDIRTLSQGVYILVVTGDSFTTKTYFVKK